MLAAGGQALAEQKSRHRGRGRAAHPWAARGSRTRESSRASSETQRVATAANAPEQTTTRRRLQMTARRIRGLKKSVTPEDGAVEMFHRCSPSPPQGAGPGTRTRAEAKRHEKASKPAFDEKSSYPGLVSPFSKHCATMVDGVPL